MTTFVFTPTHLLNGQPVQLTGWNAFRDRDRVEYVTEHGGYHESKWCQRADLSPLPTAHLAGILPKPSNGNLYGTCAHCEATCVRVFLAERDAEEGFCADCIVNVL